MEGHEKTKDKLYIGIDLGTSRSAFVSSNGTRQWIDSYVGWPKDFISAKVLGRDILFGAEALENRLSLDIFRPLERGVIKEGTEKNEEAVKELIRHLLLMAKPDEGQRIYAVVGVPASSLKVNKLAIRKAVSDSVDSMMVVSEPFAVAYGLNLLNNALIIDIGAGTVDFCIMRGAMPEEGDQKTILTAGDYVDEQLFGSLKEKYPESAFNINMVRRVKETHSFVGKAAGKIEVMLPIHGKPVSHDITDEIKKACESILPPIIDTTIDLIAGFDPEFQAKVKENIFIAGGGSLIKGISDYIRDGLKDFGRCKVHCVDDPLYAGANGAYQLAVDMPEKYWEQI
ncbi:MAG: rod shape-determining protein [Nitrospirae bacterium]|nr:rod shape-determining protein [Nitrospirota bacterium]